MFIVNPYIFATGGGGTVPTSSLDFERDSSQYLSISQTDFGEYDRQKFAISVWLKRESIGTFQSIYAMEDSVGDSSDREIRLYFASNNTIEFFTGSVTNGRLRTNATYTSTSAWMHILVHFDGANATAGDRMKMWIDGTEVTSFGIDQNPTNDIPNAANVVWVGRFGASNHFDGLIYQLAFFSGSLPAISDVYDAGSPKDVSGLTGLFSCLDANGSAVSDSVLSADWTNNGTVTTSATVP